jgi:predicted N-acetyltransferase YhbS
MPDPKTIPYRQPLSDGLVLRTATDKRDVDRVAEFNGLIHEPQVGAMTRELFRHHPNTDPEDLIFVEDEGSGQVVSSLCLIPWTWRYETVQIPAGEMGIVGTLEPYRRRGLIRAQVDYFKRRLHKRGCLLSHIQGIPTYYRQFGYEYALPLEGGLRLELRHVPALRQEPFQFNLATLDDLPTLARLYEDASQDLAISAVRDSAIWRYLLTHSQETEMKQDVYLLRNAEKAIAGYMCVPHTHFGEELVISEVSRLRYDAALAVLNHAKKLATERNKPGLRLNLPANSTLMRLARPLDGYDMGTYAWQIHVPDTVALLRALAPVLERRISGSPFSGLTHDLRLNLYRETVLLRFEGGHLTEVASEGPTGKGEASFPPGQFVPVLLGYRTVEEQHTGYPDVDVTPVWRLLIDTLFPKVPSFIHTIY